MREFIKVMKALSDPNRVKMVKLLQRRVMCVCEIQETLGLAQSTASKHLKMMYEAGMLSRRREGNSILYSVTDPVVWRICETVCTGIEQQQKDRADVLRRGGLKGR